MSNFVRFGWEMVVNSILIRLSRYITTAICVRMNRRRGLVRRMGWMDRDVHVSGTPAGEPLTKSNTLLPRASYSRQIM